MLGLINIWWNRWNYIHEVKVKFGDLWFYLEVYSRREDPDLLLTDNIIANSCSYRERWTELGKPDYSNYRNISLPEILRIIFMKALDSEKEIRERELYVVCSYYKLPYYARVHIYRWCSDLFQICIKDRSFTIRKSLPARKNKRKPRNVEGWLERATSAKVEQSECRLGNYLGNYEISLPCLFRIFNKENMLDDLIKLWDF